MCPRPPSRKHRQCSLKSIFILQPLILLPGGGQFDVVVSKDVLWYVLDDLSGYLSALVGRSSRLVYIGQSFPDHRPFYGEEILPNAQSLLAYLEKEGYLTGYSVVERDAAYGGREYFHALIEVSQ